MSPDIKADAAPAWPISCMGEACTPPEGYSDFIWGLPREALRVWNELPSVGDTLQQMGAAFSSEWRNLGLASCGTSRESPAQQAAPVSVEIRGKNLQGEKLDHPYYGVRFADCDLQGADFRGASLAGAEFVGVRFGVSIDPKTGQALHTKFDDTPEARRVVSDSKNSTGIDQIEWMPVR